MSLKIYNISKGELEEEKVCAEKLMHCGFSYPAEYFPRHADYGQIQRLAAKQWRDLYGRMK